MIPRGYCQCGCGQRTKIVDKSCASRGRVAGEPYRYVHGHNRRATNRKTKYVNRYVVRNGVGQHVHEHVLVAERVLGKKLPSGAEVHHVNGNKRDNRNCNLVVCNDAAYHQMLEVRTRALAACGHPDWRKCSYCKGYDAQENLVRTKRNWYHNACAVRYNRKNRTRRRMAGARSAR